jgi:hypothetical protein
MPTKLRTCSPVVMKPRIFAGGFAAGAGGFGLLLAIRYWLCPSGNPSTWLAKPKSVRSADFAASMT